MRKTLALLALAIVGVSRLAFAQAALDITDFATVAPFTTANATEMNNRQVQVENAINNPVGTNLLADAVDNLRLKGTSVKDPNLVASAEVDPVLTGSSVSFNLQDNSVTITRMSDDLSNNCSGGTNTGYFVLTDDTDATLVDCLTPAQVATVLDAVLPGGRSAADCTALTDGIADDICCNTGGPSCFQCQPSAGGCDTAGEWIAVGGTGSGGAFSDASDPIVQNTTTKDVVIGTSAVNTSKVTIDGDSDQVQLTVQGNATQTDSLIIAETSAGAEVANVNVDGSILCQSIQDIDGPGTNFSISAAGAIAGQSLSIGGGAASISAAGAIVGTSLDLGASATPAVTLEDSTNDDSDIDFQIAISDNVSNDTDADFDVEVAGVMTTFLSLNGTGNNIVMGSASQVAGITFLASTATDGTVVFPNNAIGGLELDGTLNKAWTGSHDFSGGTLEVPNGAAPTTSAFGQIAADNDAWAASRGAIQTSDGTASTFVVATLASDTPTNGQVPTWNTGGTITWEAGSAAEVNALEGDGASGIANTEIFIGTGAGTGNYAALSGPVGLANDGTTTITRQVEVDLDADAWVLHATAPPTEATYGTTFPRNVLQFDNTTADDIVGIRINIPTTYDNSVQPTLRVDWTADAVANEVCWCARTASIADSADTTPAAANTYCASSTVDLTTTDLNQTTITITTASDFVAGNEAVIQLFRDQDESETGCAAGTDDMADTADLHTVVLTYQVSE